MQRKHTIDEFDFEPVVFDFFGEVDYGMELGEVADMEGSEEELLSHKYFDLVIHLAFQTCMD